MNEPVVASSNQSAVEA